MKQFFSILLILFTFVSSVGIKWIDHYCAMEATLNESIAICESEEMNCCASTNESTKVENPGCCETEINLVYVPFNFFEQASSFEFQTHLPIISEQHLTSFDIFQNPFNPENSTNYADLPPPPLIESGRAICILNQLFRI